MAAWGLGLMKPYGDGRRGWLLPVTAGVALAALVAVAQQPAPEQAEQSPTTLQVTAQSVVLDVVVTNKKGEIVKGLTQDVFTVYEDKAPQQIESFEEMSAKTAAPATLNAAVNSTAQLDQAEPDAPVSILVIDELTTRFEDLAFARYSLKKYLKAQGDTLEQPTMLIAANYRNISVLRDYTTSRKEILDALDHHTANYAEVARAGNVSWQADQINATFGSLIGVAEATAGHRGHKNMIWIGRGFPPVNMATMLPEMQNDFLGVVATCTRLLRDSRVTLYAVDPAGIRAEEPARDGADYYVDDPFGGQVDFDTMAVATGGKALHGRNDVDNMIDASVRDGESFYTLSYKPEVKSETPKDFRKIRVVMKDSDLRASTRSGYFAMAAPVAPVKEANGKFSQRLIFDMSVASNSLLVYDGVPLTVRRDEPAGDRFELTLHAADLPLDNSDRPTAEFTVLAESFDRKDKMLNQTARLLKVRMSTRAPSSGPDKRIVQLPVTIATKAPAVRLRFVVRANATGKVGAENFFLVDKKALADPALGTNPNRTYR
jgi:VWFA-related protein